MRRQPRRIAATLAAVGALFAVMLSTAQGAFANGMTLTPNEVLALNNDTASEGTDCPADGGKYWHFVISPNGGDSVFITFHLNLGDTSTYDTSVYVPNGTQLDNVFVAVPAGKQLTSLVKAGSTADIWWDGDRPQPTKFELSHVCVGTTVDDPDLTIQKTAIPSYTRTFGWTLDKSVDRTVAKQFGGPATFSYTVAVAKDAGTDSAWAVTGTITVGNPNAIDVSGVSLTDSTPGGVCTVTPATVDVAAGATATADYECTFSSNPGSGTNTATASWADFGSPNTSASTSVDYTFGSPTLLVNDSIDVTDTVGGNWVFAQSGSVQYQRTLNVPTWDCLAYDNTASITETGQSDSQSVTVCGPMHTGALTMGYWQNKNGQAQIKNAGSVGGVCNLTPFLRQYAPFQDLSATASCTTAATYVTNVIKAANASGAAMNAMLKGQMLATALDVYFYGIGSKAVDLTLICTDLTCTAFEDSSAEFGGTPKTVSEMLTYAASQSNVGGSVWYGNVKLTQELAKDAFDAINNEKVFGA